MKRLLLVANQSWNFWNFRRELISHFLEVGYEVHLLAPQDQTSNGLKAMGANFIHWPLEARGKNIFLELRSVWFLFRTIKQLRPLAVCTFTIKPNLYGGIVAKLLNTPVLMNVTGLGETFQRRGPFSLILRRLYGNALKNAQVTFFQNSDDEKVIREFVSEFNSRRVPGSGVNLARFASEEKNINKTHFAMAARLLPEKGVAEFVAAAQIIRTKYQGSRFLLVGDFVTDSARSQLWPLVERAVQAQDLTYLPHVDDVRSVFEQVGTVVLPTYYNEGVPRTLLEAAAMSRVLITTDRPGCRDIVSDGKTGYLCEPKSVPSLVRAMEKVLQSDDTQIKKLTSQAYARVRDHFAVSKVIDAYGSELSKVEELHD